MRADPVFADPARRVTPRALRVYAQALGWQPVEGVDGGIAVFHRPDSPLHQLIVPLDEQLDDSAELVDHGRPTRRAAAVPGHPGPDPAGGYGPALALLALAFFVAPWRHP